VEISYQLSMLSTDFEMGQPQGIAPTQCHVGAIPLDEPFALKYLFICASVLIN